MSTWVAVTALLTAALVFVSLCLVIVTAVYAWFTLRAARATEHYAAIAEERADVRFLGLYVDKSYPSSPSGVLRLVCCGDPVHVQAVLVDYIVVPGETNEVARELHRQACKPLNPDQGPVHLYRGEGTAFLWPRPTLDRELAEAGFIVRFVVRSGGNPDERTVKVGSPGTTYAPPC